MNLSLKIISIQWFISIGDIKIFMFKFEDSFFVNLS